MSNSVDILYYDTLIESAIEDRNIRELIFNSNCKSLLLNESTDELAICEANIFETMVNAISALFQKVIDFFKKLIEKITGKLLFKTDRKLIEHCKEKIKSMTSSERDRFQLVNFSMIDDINDNLDWCNEQQSKMDKFLGLSIAATNKFLNSSRIARTEKPLSDSQFDMVKSGIVKLNAEIEEYSNIENLRKTAKDVSFNTVRFVLDEYSVSENTMKDLNSEFKKISEEMKKNQRTMNDHVKYNRQSIIKKHDQVELSKYRDLIHLVTGSVIKLARFKLNMNILLLRNQEAILRRFLSTGSDIVVNSNYKMIEANS